MPRITASVAIAVIFAVGIGSNAIGMMVAKRAERIAVLEKSLQADRNRIAALDVELDYLAGPQRVQALVNQYRADMVVPEAKQYAASLADVLPPASAPVILASSADTAAISRAPALHTHADEPMPRLGNELAALIKADATLDAGGQ